MLLWVVQITIISFIFIFLLHHLFHFFKSTLTVPKIKDLVNSPTKKYENIYDILSKNSESPHKINNMNSSSSTEISFLPKSLETMDQTTIGLLPTPSTSTNMKDELKNFLKSQMNQNTTKSGESISYYEFK